MKTLVLSTLAACGIALLSGCASDQPATTSTTTTEETVVHPAATTTTQTTVQPQ